VRYLTAPPQPRRKNGAVPAAAIFSALFSRAREVAYKQKNIMFEDHTLGTLLSARTLWADQIRELQDRLANHHTRRGDRD
jgi:hypothetical protein